MKICINCKTENEDRFSYCKNCGTLLEGSKKQPTYSTASGGYTVNSATVPTGLVPVTIMLPNPEFPDYRTAQTVYVTPAQKAAIEYSLSKQTPPKGVNSENE